MKKGEVLAEIETDKATMELESYKDGTLLHIGIDKGGKLQVNDLLAIIGEPGEDIKSLLQKQPAEQKAAEPEISMKKENSGSVTEKSSAKGGGSVVSGGIVAQDNAVAEKKNSS